jgi:hypothetical protein
MRWIVVALVALVLAGCGARSVSRGEAQRALDDLGDVRRSPDESWRPGLAAFCSVHAACAGSCAAAMRDYASTGRADSLLDRCDDFRREMPQDRPEMRDAYADQFVAARIEAYLAQVRPALDTMEQRELDRLRDELGL